MTHFCIFDGAPVRTEPGLGDKVATLLKFNKVDVLDSVVTKYAGVPTTFHEIEMLDGRRGWVYAGYLNRYSGNPATLRVQNPTENKYDAAQFIVYDGKVQYNLCGFFCVAHALDIDIPIEWMINTLKEKKPTLMQRVFNSQNRGLTGAPDLAEFLGAFDTRSMPLSDVFKDKVSKTVIFTPEGLETLLSTYKVIIAVTINKTTGRLSRTGIRHWVEVTSCTPVGMGGGVELFNPYGEYEFYGWETFAESVGIPSGVIFSG